MIKAGYKQACQTEGMLCNKQPKVANDLLWYDQESSNNNLLFILDESAAYFGHQLIICSVWPIFNICEM